MEGVPENALQPVYFVAEMKDTETSQLACADTQTHVFHVGNTARNRVFHGDNPIRACPTSANHNLSKHAFLAQSLKGVNLLSRKMKYFGF